MVKWPGFHRMYDTCQHPGRRDARSLGVSCIPDLQPV